MTTTDDRPGSARPPLHRQGRRGQDVGRRGHGAALRRRRACARWSSPPTRPTRWPTASTCRSAPSRRRSPPRLSGQQLDAQERMEESWGEIQDYLVEVFDWAGVEAIEAEELAVVPGLDEVFALGDIKTHAESGRVGRARRRLRARPPRRSACCPCPTSSRWYMERVFPMGRRVNRMIGPGAQPGDQPAGGRRRGVRRRPAASTTASTGSRSCSPTRRSRACAWW